MDTDFLDAIAGGLDEIAGLAGERFVFGQTPVTGDFTGTEYSRSVDMTGGAQESLHGVLIISRAAYPTLAPVELSIIIGPDGKKYRIGQLATDAGAWTLTLTHPNARRT